jgi:hypothetical protein
VKRTLTVAAAVAALFAATPAAQAAPADDKALCKSGGFANYVDPTTDLPFADQGRCIEHVNAGGALAPVAAPIEGVFTFSPSDAGKCLFRFEASGLESQTSYPFSVDWTWNGEPQNIPGTLSTFDGTTWDWGTQADVDTPVSMTVGDQTFRDQVTC